MTLLSQQSFPHFFLNSVVVAVGVTVGNLLFCSMLGALATLGILTFLTSWNNFLWPLVVAQSEDKYTLPVVFIALQRHFVQGIAMAGIT
jgi:ABC-type glycerol-3-phosphate transport system permease component